MLILAHPVKKFPTFFFGTRNFITVFTIIRHWFQS